MATCTYLVNSVGCSIIKVLKPQSQASIAPTVRYHPGQGNWVRKWICEQRPIPYYLLGFGLNDKLYPYSGISSAAGHMQTCAVKFWSYSAQVGLSWDCCCGHFRYCAQDGGSARCRGILGNWSHSGCFLSGVTNSPVQALVRGGPHCQDRPL